MDGNIESQNSFVTQKEGTVNQSVRKCVCMYPSFGPISMDTWSFCDPGTHSDMGLLKLCFANRAS